MIKLTDTTACSSLPTPEQLRALGTFGLRSVLNLLDPRETCFDAKEPACVPAEDSVQYLHAPLLSLQDRDDLRAAVAAVLAAPKPILVHCDTGVRAGLVALMAAAVETESAADVTPQLITDWGKDMGLELKPHSLVAASVVHELAAAVAATTTTKQPSPGAPATLQGRPCPCGDGA